MEDRGLTGRQTYNDELSLEYLANHYYLPAVYSKGKRLDYIRHIIDTDSEVRFLNALRDYTKKNDSVLRQLDWWMFSKLDQYLDTPFIPYYDPKQNRIARFIPDFIFWGQKGDDYTILFVDPKGMEQIDWERKVDGYRRLLRTLGATLHFEHDGAQVAVRLFLFTRTATTAPRATTSAFGWTGLPGCSRRASPEPPLPDSPTLRMRLASPQHARERIPYNETSAPSLRLLFSARPDAHFSVTRTRNEDKGTGLEVEGMVGMGTLHIRHNFVSSSASTSSNPETQGAPSSRLHEHHGYPPKALAQAFWLGMCCRTPCGSVANG